MNIKEEHNSADVYKSIAFLAGMLHLVYLFLFWKMGCIFMACYNIFSIGVYALAIFFVCHGWARACITMAHLEVCLFVTLAVLVTGWSFGFQLLLICTASLVYFCPYRHRFTPYIASICELVLFMGLYLVTKYTGWEPVMGMESGIFKQVFYLLNSFAVFFLILFSAYRANLSSKTIQDQLLEENRGLSQMATHDSLTGLWARRAASEMLGDLWDECLRGNEQFTVAMGDVDDFKSINDTYGHGAGDTVLKSVSALFMPLMTFRWGGEEFLFVFPGQSKGETLEEVETLSQKIAGLTFCFDGRELHTSMTFGLADSTEGSTIEEIVSIADQRMYKGKRAGKNRVTA